MHDVIERTAKEAASYFQNFFSWEVAGGGFLGGDARIKLPCLFLLVYASVSTFELKRLLVLLAVLFLLLVTSRIRLKLYFSRVWMIPAFSVLVLSPFLLSDPVYVFVFALRVFLAVSFLTLFMLTTPYSDTIAAMRSFKLPEIITSTVSLTLRYIHLMFAELYRMLLARDARQIKHPDFVDTWRKGGELLGSFFIRAYERGERVYLASVARGYSGKTKVYGKKFKPTIADVVLVAITAAVLI
ncbi:energy-coupling factor transporter transmembrane component T family protein [Archaeoglobus veneficus]|uniref:Cobalt ABC transporter, inner membrane subunit CbiQ n=1 Tax=Archaeoglobus veneficus (strain DSM 11195 / SNP6) TaxID=693661 RepID=F2KQZ9_ARCVS|nr:CbiQ family ECF transporter T component [Archaeoglobus veneficus]AEA47805.1 cobalt ABC transporter, inner membrane subunit CbiQ [Archaeoglobus veneficus SNP6]